jgi:hypothetical protein
MKNERNFYFFPAAFRRAAQRAFIDSESLRRPAAVSPRFFPAGFAVVVAPPPALRRAAQRAFIDSDSLRRPAAVKPRRRPPDALAAGAAPAVLVVVPLRRAQRARAAAASFARVAADIGRRPPRLRRPPRRRPPPKELVEPVNRLANRSSSALICFLIESACVSC